MSTRCQIQVEGSKVLLYVHSDGYCSGILPTLLPFVAKFHKGRGDDPEYMPARILQVFMNNSDQRIAEFHSNLKTSKLFGAPPPYEGMLGFGVDTELHGDIEWLYIVKKGGAVEVQSVTGWGDNQKFTTLKTFPVGTDPKAALESLGEEGK